MISIGNHQVRNYYTIFSPYLYLHFFFSNQPKLYWQSFSISLKKASKQRLHWQSFFLYLEKVSYFLFTACHKAKEENQAKTKLIDKNYKIENTFHNCDVDYSKDTHLDS